MRLIDADTFKKWLLENSINEREEKESLQIGIWIDAFPSAEPERKKGKWIWQTENRYVCSECGHHTQVDELFEEPMYAFCPYCSTSMLDEDGNVRYER